MVITGRDKMEHDRNFLAFMEKCMKNNLILNSEKIQFMQSQISFYGYCWSQQAFHWIQRRLKLSIIWNFHWTSVMTDNISCPTHSPKGKTECKVDSLNIYCETLCHNKVYMKNCSLSPTYSIPQNQVICTT